MTIGRRWGSSVRSDLIQGFALMSAFHPFRTLGQQAFARRGRTAIRGWTLFPYGSCLETLWRALGPLRQLVRNRFFEKVIRNPARFRAGRCPTFPQLTLLDTRPPNVRNGWKADIRPN